MAYDRTRWINGETALSDNNLNHMEKGIEDAHKELVTVTNDIENLEGKIDSLGTRTQIRNEIINAIFPVGSLYFSANSTNPSSVLGGTWERWGVGRVPVGVDPTDPDFNAADKWGGSKTHALSLAEIPSHAHTYIRPMQQSLAMSGSQRAYRYSYEETQNTSTIGGGKPHNNLQPYITCYMWKRTK